MNIWVESQWLKELSGWQPKILFLDRVRFLFPPLPPPPSFGTSDPAGGKRKMLKCFTGKYVPTFQHSFCDLAAY